MDGETICMENTEIANDIVKMLAAKSCTMARAQDILYAVSNLIRKTAVVQLDG